MWGWNRFIPVAIVSIASSLLSIAPSVALEPPEIAAQAAKFVVKIDGGGGGTGFIVRKNGNRYTVLTNEHVIRSAVNYTITTSDNRRYIINSNLIRKVSGVDLAEIEFTSTTNYSAAELSNSSTNSLGRKIYSYGFNAISQGLPERSPQFLQGSIAGNLPSSRNGYSLTFNLTAMPGLSGSPLLDESGKVIGVYGLADRQGGGFTVTLGIPIDIYQRYASYIRLANTSANLVRCSILKNGEYVNEFIIQRKSLSPQLFTKGTEIRCQVFLSENSTTLITYFEVDEPGNTYQVSLGEVENNSPAGIRSATIITHPNGSVSYTKFEEAGDGKFIRILP
jgi:serine protease Do